MTGALNKEACKMTIEVPEMVIDPAAFAMLIPVPAVNVARTGSAPVEPIGNCPLVATPRDVKLPVALPICSEWFVVPETLNVNVLALILVLNDALSL